MVRHSCKGSRKSEGQTLGQYLHDGYLGGDLCRVGVQVVFRNESALPDWIVTTCFNFSTNCETHISRMRWVLESRIVSIFPSIIKAWFSYFRGFWNWFSYIEPRVSFHLRSLYFFLVFLPVIVFLLRHPVLHLRPLHRVLRIVLVFRSCPGSFVIRRSDFT